MPPILPALTAQPFLKRNEAPGSINLAGNYTVTAADYKKLIHNTAASAAAPVVSFDPNLPVDFEVSFLVNNASFGMQLQVPAGQQFRNGPTLITTVGGTVTWAATAYGSLTFRKLSSTIWVTYFSGGTSATLA